MKKSILLIAAALLLCGKVNAQEIALATNTDINAELSLAANLQTDMSGTPTLDYTAAPSANLNSNYNLQYSSPRKGWGIACIIAGGLTMTGGLSVWLFGDTFNKVSSTMPTGFEPNPEYQQATGAVSQGIKTAGIIGTVLGAALVATGIVLVAGDKGSGNRRHRRYSENLLAPQPYTGEWTLSLNAGPTSGGLTLTF
jgi:hypothetical protein